MNGKHFKYDPDRLHYQKIERNLKKKVVVILSYVTASLILAVVLVIFGSMLIDTPAESKVKQENQDLIRDYKLLSEKYAKVDTVLKELRDKDENIYRAIFETEPLEGKSFFDDPSADYNYLLRLSNEKIIDSVVFQLNEIFSQVDKNSAAFSNLISNADSKKEMLKHLPAIQPIVNPDLTRLASGYGNRMHPMYKIIKFHEGMDFTAPTGTEVFATGDGIVEDLDRTRRGHGNTVIIDHGFGYKTVYSHLDKFNVKKGQQVTRGDVIGWVGNTGLSVAPHLHYEVHLNGQPVNPVNYYFLDLQPAEYYKMIELSVKSGQSFD